MEALLSVIDWPRAGATAASARTIARIGSLMWLAPPSLCARRSPGVAPRGHRPSRRGEGAEALAGRHEVGMAGWQPPLVGADRAPEHAGGGAAVAALQLGQGQEVDAVAHEIGQRGGAGLVEANGLGVD